MSKNKKVEITPGKLICDACMEKKLTELDLLYKLERVYTKKKSKKVIKKNTIKLWIKDLDFPDLEDMYALSEVLEINPSDLMAAKNELQESLIHKPDEVLRRQVAKALTLAEPIAKVIWWFIIAGIAIVVAIMLGNGFKNKGNEENYYIEHEGFEKNWEENVKPLLQDYNTTNNIE